MCGRCAGDFSLRNPQVDSENKLMLRKVCLSKIKILGRMCWKNMMALDNRPSCL